MTTKTTDRAEINRRNAQKSTGPRTPEGKSRSRFNAVKHGLAAKTLVLPGEDPEVFQMRIEAWTADLQPENDVEQYLVERAATISWQLDRVNRADASRLASIIRDAPAEEARRQEGEVAVLGRRLFLDSHRALRRAVLEGRAIPLPHSGRPDSPDHPAAIVFQLEASAAGCRWLLDRWAELRAGLEQHQDWTLHDRLEAFRLLGKPSLDAPGDADVAAVMPIGARQQATMEDCRGIERDAADVPDDMLSLFDESVTDEGIANWSAEDAAVERDQLRAIVDRAIARLETLTAAHRERAMADAADQAARLSFDDSVDGERLRRYQMSCNRSLFRTLDALLKLRRSSPSGSGKRGGGCGEGPPTPAQAETVAESSLVLGPSSLVRCFNTPGSPLFPGPGAPNRSDPQPTTVNGRVTPSRRYKSPYRAGLTRSTTTRTRRTNPRTHRSTPKTHGTNPESHSATSKTHRTNPRA